VVVEAMVLENGPIGDLALIKTGHCVVAGLVKNFPRRLSSGATVFGIPNGLQTITHRNQKLEARKIKEKLSHLQVFHNCILGGG
jgi:hypothetical protein